MSLGNDFFQMLGFLERDIKEINEKFQTEEH